MGDVSCLMKWKEPENMGTELPPRISKKLWLLSEKLFEKDMQHNYEEIEWKSTSGKLKPEPDMGHHAKNFQMNPHMTIVLDLPLCPLKVIGHS